MDDISNWNFELISLAKEFAFNAGFFVTLLAICCLFLWIGIFYKLMKIFFTFVLSLFILACFQGTPNFLLNRLLSDEDKQLQQEFSSQKNHPLIANPLPDCVHDAKGIVLLGGGVFPAGYLSYSSQERLLGLVSLLKKSPEQKMWRKEKIPIVLSGGSPDKNSTTSEAQAIQKYALYIYGEGFKDFNTILDTESKNTYQNAAYSNRIFEKKDYPKDIILITNTFHMQRAQKAFQAQGFHVCPVSVASSNATGSGIFNFQNAIATTTLLNEYFGTLGYKIRGWL